jgi:Ni/Co efflux regulator RcnB
MAKPVAPSGAKFIARVAMGAAVGALLASAGVQAADNGNKDRGRSEKSDKGNKSRGDGGPEKKGSENKAADKKGADKKDKFSKKDRAAVRAYFAKADTCPPGLAKKRNGCMPPGQAKKEWAVGSPLPPAVVSEPVPTELAERLGLPPAGHAYARVAGDILMVAEGTRTVVDAITNLGQ